MRTLVNVLDIGGKSLHAESRASIEAAALRWGSTLRVIGDDRLPQYPCKWWNKFAHLDEQGEFDLALQLDADVTIWEQAPSPFEVADPACLNMVAEWQPEHGSVPGHACWFSDNINNSLLHAVGWWALKMDLKPCPFKEYVNGGFMLYNPHLAVPWFDKVLSYAPLCNGGSHGWSDQTVVSTLCYNGIIPLHRLDTRFNAMHAGTALGLLGPGHDGVFIKHFCSPARRAARIAASSWRSRYPHPPRVPDV